VIRSQLVPYKSRLDMDILPSKHLKYMHMLVGAVGDQLEHNHIHIQQVQVV
jgi:hypothetical protein